MRYRSTRGQAPEVGLSEALNAGLAADGGLYLPDSWPRFDPADFDEIDADDLPALGTRLLAPFFAGDPLADELAAICREAFDFPAPVAPTREPRLSLLELFHGESAAFKDFGARFLAASMARLRQPGQPAITVLVATSGDTGGAVASAFHGREGFRVVVLYPEGRVSPRQAAQLEAFGGNVLTLRVAGRFDDCQTMVKQAFADTALREACPLTSANSISLGRLLPQMLYHASAALRSWREFEAPVGAIVPSGNLGNALAAWLVGTMGLPIGQVLLASNANRVLPEWLASGEYRPRPSIETLANAMDVGAPSNLERLTALLDAGVEGPRLHALAVDDAVIRETVAAAETRYGHVVCPHTACALHAFETEPACREGHWYAAATAHPAKFESVVEPLIGHAIELPRALGRRLSQPRHSESLPADYAALRERLLRD